jgi:hypothetical protein
VVARHGNAPRSAGCGPAAFLLSYRAMKKWHPHPVMLRGLPIESRLCCCTMRADETGGAPRIAAPAACLHRSAYGGSAGARRIRTLDTIAGATAFKTASSTSRTRSVCEMAPPLGIAPSSHRLTGGPHTLCVERNALRGSAKPTTAERSPHSRRSGNCSRPRRRLGIGRSAGGRGSRTCVIPFRRWMPVVCSATGADEMVARLYSPTRRQPLFPSSSSVLPRVSPRPKRGGLLSSSRAN